MPRSEVHAYAAPAAPVQPLFEALFHGSADGIALVDAQGSVRELNAAAAAMFGLDRHAARGCTFSDLLDAPLSAWSDDTHWTQGVGMEPSGGNTERQGRRSDGNPFPVAVRLTRVHQPGTEPAPYVATLRDLTDSRAADEAIAMTLAEMDSATRRYEGMLRHAAFGIVLTDPCGAIQALNPAARRLLAIDAAPGGLDAGFEDAAEGSLSASAQGLNFDRFIDRGAVAGPEQVPLSAGRWLAALGDTDHVENEVTLRRADGSAVPALLATSVLRGADGQPEALLHMAYDISARRQQEATMRRLAFSDPLTGLANRALLERELEAALGSAARQGRALCLLFIDLDRFKPINDRYGHAAGDAVLREIAARIQRVIRVGDLACRIGGDEFVVLLPAVRQASDGERVAAKLRAAIAAPIEFAGQVMDVGASIGVVVSPDAGEDVAQLLHAADLAMYRAKQAGRSAAR